MSKMGRNMGRVSVFLTPRLREGVDRMAESLRVTKAQVIRVALGAGLRMMEKGLREGHLTVFKDE